ncbi:hypothetical protein [Lactococcus taiwanensis]|uniref:hypothetical protein n=1 Tax=Lactococcus taiwanensis TaxID=1151742 RepID=UPI001964AFBC|nr:hypothetical protein [Lactococcus taiwanensis]QRZ11716.1 hypothetical protein JVB21_03465 [Lactococcus taiwanensis]
MEQIFENTQQFSSQMLANRRYIKSIKEIMGTTFKLGVELSEEEQAIFALFNLLNSMYIVLQTDSTQFVENLKEIDNEFLNEKLDFDKDPNLLFDEILSNFSKEKNGVKEGLVFSVDTKSDTIVLSIKDRNMRSNIKLYQDEQRKRVEQARLLNETSLITISNVFESLISNLISFLVIKDKTVKIQEKTLSFKQIEELGGLEEAKDYLIEKTVEDIMRGSQIHWLEYIAKNTLKDFYKELVGDEQQKFIEFFLKRNLIIHNNSKINKKYINATKKDSTDEQKKELIGNRISVNEEYLLENLSLIYIVGIKSSYYVTKKNFGTKRKEIFNFYHQIAYENLKINENKVAYEIYNMLWKDRDALKASEKMLLCINYMQSLKWVGKIAELKKLLKEEDFSLADHQHQMCIEILNENYEEAIKKFEEVLNEGKEEYEDEMSMINQFISWPIFKEFSKSEQFNIFMSSKGYKELKVIDEVID